MSRKRAVEGLSPLQFVLNNPVFTLEEFTAALRSTGATSTAIRDALNYHVSTGRLLNPRRGLYFTTVERPPDPWLIASKLTPDAVLAWDGALSFHGITGLGHQLTVMARNRVKEFTYNEVIYRSSKPPRMGKYAEDGVVTVKHAGAWVRVTTPERTLVDCLDGLELGPGLEGLWDGYVGRALDGARVVEAAVRLRSQLTAMRTALFLHYLPKCRVTGAELGLLRRFLPKRDVWADPTNRTCDERRLGAWRIYVPGTLLDRMLSAELRR